MKGRKNIINFKGFDIRNNSYILIDNLGNSWIPIYEEKVFESYEGNIEKRKLIGNINNYSDWNKICKRLTLIKER